MLLINLKIWRVLLKKFETGTENSTKYEEKKVGVAGLKPTKYDN